MPILVVIDHPKVKKMGGWVGEISKLPKTIKKKKKKYGAIRFYNYYEIYYQLIMFNYKYKILANDHHYVPKFIYFGSFLNNCLKEQ